MDCCCRILALLILLCVSENADGSAKTDPPSVKPTTVPTDTPFITLVPAIKEKYRLNLTNPGPSILDSTLSFVAELRTESGEKIPEDMKFSFVWMNMADLDPKKTEDKSTATIPLSFSSEAIDAGDYTMTVVASEQSNPSKILAFQTKKFVLTKKLNGHLHLQQDLEYQRLSDTFSTGIVFTANAVIMDHFEAQQTPRFQFFWYEDEKFIITTQLPEVVTTVDKPGNFSLKSEILATMAVKRANETEATAVNDVKNGNFEQKLYFKDPLANCYIDRVDTRPTDRDVKIGIPAVINITCQGSGPTAVCLNITRYNTNQTQGCQPGTFVDGLHHQVQVKLNQSGWHDVHFSVFNDVSRKRYTLAYYAYDPSTGNLPALVLPIVFVTLGFLVVVGGAVYIMRLRKKPLVEVADFDFHPTLNESSSGGPPGMRLSLVANTLKYMMTRRKWTGSRQSKPARTETCRLGELENSGSSTRSEIGAHLYEEL